jgi:hypothetical protein
MSLVVCSTYKLFFLQTIKAFRNIRHNQTNVTIIAMVISRRGCILPTKNDSSDSKAPSKIIVMDVHGDVREITFWPNQFGDKATPYDQQRRQCDSFVNNFQTWETYVFKNLEPKESAPQ